MEKDKMNWSILIPTEDQSMTNSTIFVLHPPGADFMFMFYEIAKLAKYLLIFLYEHAIGKKRDHLGRFNILQLDQ